MSNSVHEIGKHLKESRILLKNKEEEIMTLLRQRGLATARPGSPRSMGNTVEDLDSRLEILKVEVENLPFTIEALSQDLENAKKQKARDAEHVAKNAPSYVEMKRLSRLLLLQLQKAEATNQKLKNLNQICTRLQKETNIKVKRDGICGGFESLSLLLMNCKSENEGNGRYHVFVPFHQRM